MDAASTGRIQELWLSAHKAGTQKSPLSLSWRREFAIPDRLNLTNRISDLKTGAQIKPGSIPKFMETQSWKDVQKAQQLRTGPTYYGHQPGGVLGPAQGFEERYKQILEGIKALGLWEGGLVEGQGGPLSDFVQNMLDNRLCRLCLD